MPHSRAAALASSTETPAPSLPVAASLPSGAEAELAGDDEMLAAPHRADIVGDGGGGRRQRDAEFGKAPVRR